MARPLIISDCDGVLLAFARPFAAYLAAEHGLALRLESFALAGNIYGADGRALPPERFPALLEGFFTSCIERQPAVEGAAAALARLAQACDIVVLTNVADHHAAPRARALASLGMPYRVLSNHGPKGGPVKALVEEYGPSRTVFIDDLPPHLGSARRMAPDVHCLHMVAEAELRHLIPPAPEADARIDEWADALPHIETLIGG